MFVLCHLSGNTDRFILYDKKDFDLKEIGLQVEDIEILEPNKILTDYSIYPILELNEFLLRIIKPRELTITHRLGELGLDCVASLAHEMDLIYAKKSKLSKRQRNMVLQRYDEIKNLCLTKVE